MTRIPPLVALVAIALVLGGCGGVPKRFPVQTRTSSTAALSGAGQTRIAVIVMENEEFSRHHRLLGQRRTSTVWRAPVRAGPIDVRDLHPSLPNYLALTGGSTFGITSDCTELRRRAAGLGRQLLAARVSLEGVHGGPPPPLLHGRATRASTPRSTTRSCTTGRSPATRRAARTSCR